jgi:hypothetical protein
VKILKVPTLNFAFFPQGHRLQKGDLPAGAGFYVFAHVAVCT